MDSESRGFLSPFLADRNGEADSSPESSDEFSPDYGTPPTVDLSYPDEGEWVPFVEPDSSHPLITDAEITEAISPREGECGCHDDYGVALERLTGRMDAVVEQFNSLGSQIQFLTDTVQAIGQVFLSVQADLSTMSLTDKVSALRKAFGNDGTE